MNFIYWIQKHEHQLRALSNIAIGISLGLILAVILIKLGVPLGI